MLFRKLSFVALMSFSLSLPASADDDLVISYSLPCQKKHKLFQEVVKNTIPGKAGADSYHITLGWIKDVKPKDFAALQYHLNTIAHRYLDNTTTFTATAAIPYLVNRAPNLCPIVLTPTQAETAKFRAINVALHAALQNFNAQTGNHYFSHPDLISPIYLPHITLANTHHIQALNLDRGTVTHQINTKLGGKVLELLRPETSSQPAPLLHKRAPHAHKRAVRANRKAVHAHKRAVRANRKAVHVHKRAVRANRRAAHANRRAAFKHNRHMRRHSHFAKRRGRR